MTTTLPRVGHGSARGGSAATSRAVPGGALNVAIGRSRSFERLVEGRGRTLSLGRGEPAYEPTRGTLGHEFLPKEQLVRRHVSVTVLLRL